MGDTGLEPVTSALSSQPNARTTTVYAPDSQCFQGFSASDCTSMSCCSPLFVGILWEVVWEPTPTLGHRLRRPGSARTKPTTTEKSWCRTDVRGTGHRLRLLKPC